VAQVQATGFVFMVLDQPLDADGKRDWRADPTWQPELWSVQVDDNDRRIFVSEQQVTVDIPADFNPVPAQVAALEAAKLAALAEYQKAVSLINARLSNLLAIEVAA